MTMDSGRGIRRCCAVMIPLLLFAGLAVGEEPDVLTVERARAVALANHPQMRRAEAEVRRARGNLTAVRSRQGVQVDLSSRYSVMSETPTIDLMGADGGAQLGEDETWLTEMSAEKVLYSGGRLEAMSRQGDLRAQTTVWLARRTAQSVAFSSEKALLNLLAAQRQIAVAEKALETAKAHHQVAKSRYEEGAAAHYDVLRAEVHVYESQQQLIEAESRRDVAHAVLLRSLGLEDGVFEADESILDRPAPELDSDEALMAALSHRPEMQALELQMQAAQAGVRAASAEDSPTVGIGASYQVATPESPLQFDHWAAGLSVSVPLFDSGYERGRVTEAKAQVADTEATADDLVQQIRLEVTEALSDLRSAKARAVAARERVRQAEETQRLAQVRYGGGVATPTEVADAQTALTRAQQELVRALAATQSARAQLELAMGTADQTAQPAQTLSEGVVE